MARKFIIILAVFIIVPNLVLVTVAFLGGKSPSAIPLPSPNGYDDFVKAGEVLSGSNGPAIVMVTPEQIVSAVNSAPKTTRKTEYSDTMSRAELETYVASRAEPLRIVREGLSKECRVPVQPLAGSPLVLLVQVNNLKKLESLFLADGRLALLEGRTNDAVRAYVDGIRFANESTRGGMEIFRVVSIACEAMMSKPLQSLVSSLDATNCHSVAQSLETVDTNEEPINDTFAEDARWSQKMYGITGQIQGLLTYKEQRKARASLLAKDQQRALQRRQLMITAAARAYGLDKGKGPASAADLVPEYLKAVPKDPATGMEMILEQ